MQKNNNIVPEVVRTALYIRVSTDEQALHGLSLEAQQSALEKYARDNKYKIAGIYIDGGKSARKSINHRTELRRLIDDVEADKIDLIIFTKLDRWFRNIKDYYKVQDILESHHVNWKTIFENYDTTTANGRLHINIMLSIAQDEADRTSERIKAVFANKLERGEVNTTRWTIGYKYDSGKIVVDHESAQVAIDLFDYFREHQSIRGTGRAILNMHNIHMAPDRVKRILRNRLYIGEYKGIQDFCEPIIDEKLFNEVQEILKNRNIKQTPSGYDFIFTGLMECAECGCRMSGNAQHSIKKNGKESWYISYRCNQYWSNRECNHKRVAGEHKIEEFLLNNIIPEIEKYICEFETSQKSKKTSKINKSEIRRKIERLKELYLNDLIDIETYRKDYTELNEKLLSAETPEIKQSLTPLREFLKIDFKNIYPTLDNEAKRILWRGIIKKITVDSDNNMKIYFL